MNYEVIVLSIDAFAVFVPTHLVSVNELSQQTALSSSMLSIYRVIYGLKNIPIWNDSVDALIAMSLDPLILTIDLSAIQYLIYVHTASFFSNKNKPRYLIAVCFDFPTSCRIRL